MRTDAMMDKRMLDLAARAAWRGFGNVEPNPMVGCVLVRPASGAGGDPRVVAIGHHRKFGGLHAERDALAAVASSGEPGAAKGATAYVTLEPCNGVGKQPPCVAALIEAGVKRVVCAASDGSHNKRGGAESLRSAGIDVEFSRASPGAARCSAPWRKRLHHGLPWVILKWAQTIDGRLAGRTGESQWISDERSRRWVHALRGRVDVVLSGVNSVIIDDPLFTARHVPVRRRATRVVLDSKLRTPTTSRLVRSASERDPVVIVALPQADDAGGGRADTDFGVKREGLLDVGVRVHSLNVPPPVAPIALEGGTMRPRSALERPDLRAALAWMASDVELGGLGATNVLVEAGPSLAGSMLRAGLVDELLAFTGPVVLGDAHGRALIHEEIESEEGEVMSRGPSIASARAGQILRLGFTRAVRGSDDVMTLWRREGFATGLNG